ncbi:MAG: MFS transporter [Candidatus Hodarchaeales archaeon]
MVIPTSRNSRAIWIAGFATLLASFQMVIFSNYVIIFLQEDLLTSIIIITIIISLRNLLQLFFRIPLGELSQIIGRKPLLLAGHFSYTTALFSLFLATHWIYVLISIIFVAFGMSCFWPALFAYIADFSPDNNFGASNGRIFQLSDIGTLFGLFISTLILDEFLLDLKDLFGFAMVLGILTGLISVYLLPEGLAKDQRKQVASIPHALSTSFISMLTSFKQITETNKLYQVYAFQLLLAFVEFMTSSFLPLIVVSKGFTRGDVSEISLWAILIIIWFKPLLGRVTDRIKYLNSISVTLFISSVTVFLFICVNEFWMLVLLYLILNGALITAYIAANSETTKRAPFDLRGTALGALGVYVSLGRTCSTIILGLIWEIFGLAEVFLFTFLSMILLTLALFAWFRSNDGKSDQAC